MQIIKQLVDNWDHLCYLLLQKLSNWFALRGLYFGHWALAHYAAGTFGRSFTPGKLDTQTFIVVGVRNGEAIVHPLFSDDEREKAKQIFEERKGLKVLFIQDLASFRAQALKELAEERATYL